MPEGARVQLSGSVEFGCASSLLVYRAKGLEARAEAGDGDTGGGAAGEGLGGESMGPRGSMGMRVAEARARWQGERRGAREGCSGSGKGRGACGQGWDLGMGLLFKLLHVRVLEFYIGCFLDFYIWGVLQFYIVCVAFGVGAKKTQVGAPASDLS